MKKRSLCSLLFILFVLTGCGDAKKVDLAVKSMERARAASAELYAPKEFKLAQDAFKKMNAQLGKGNKSDAGKLADTVVEKANKATEIARKNHATDLVERLKDQLVVAEELGLNESSPGIYNQASQSAIDAESFLKKGDHQQSINIAESGIKMIDSVLGGKESLALANLERAKELVERANRMTDIEQTKPVLDEAQLILDEAMALYKRANYDESISQSEKVIASVECLMMRYPVDGEMYVDVESGDNTQLKAHDLINQLGKTIEFIQKNNYDRPVEINVPSDEDSVMEEAMMEPISRDDDISLDMIVDMHTQARDAYDQTNYLNATDIAREGLRLSDLFLAGQTLTSHTVVRGDTLWDISESTYRNPWIWPNIWRANKMQIKDPDLIYPNQVFRIPPGPVKMQ